MEYARYSTGPVMCASTACCRAKSAGRLANQQPWPALRRHGEPDQARTRPNERPTAPSAAALLRAFAAEARSTRGAPPGASARNFAHAEELMQTHHKNRR